MDRQTEEAKYDECYKHEAYAVIGELKRQRVFDNAAHAFSLFQDSYLDVGCGRGESLDIAEEMGYSRVQGIETTDCLIDGKRVVKGAAYDIPFADNEFDVVVCYDVIEHLCPEDNDVVFKEMGRVCKNLMYLTICNTSSKLDGVELHVNLKEYEEWDDYIRSMYPHANVHWLNNLEGAKFESWRVEFNA